MSIIIESEVNVSFVKFHEQGVVVHKVCPGARQYELISRVVFLVRRNYKALSVTSVAKILNMLRRRFVCFLALALFLRTTSGLWGGFAAFTNACLDGGTCQ